MTFMYRGRFGPADPPAPQRQRPDLSDAGVAHTFRVPDEGGWDFGRLTGDYNGIHWSNWYARRFGFTKAFSHPQRVTGICMSALPAPAGKQQRLDLWIKGPLFYGEAVNLRAKPKRGCIQFGASLEGDPRFALIGDWCGTNTP